MPDWVVCVSAPARTDAFGNTNINVQNDPFSRQLCLIKLHDVDPNDKYRDVYYRNAIYFSTVSQLECLDIHRQYAFFPNERSTDL